MTQIPTDQTPADQGTEVPAAGPTPPPYAPPPAPVRKRLTRPHDDRKLAGVCGGLARYANVDATLVRVLTVVAGVVFFPVSILAYLVLWLVIPQD